MIDKSQLHFVYFVQMPLSVRDFKRFEFAKIISNGVKITVIDVSDICMLGINHKRTHYDQFKDVDLKVVTKNRDLINMLPVLNGANLVICHVGSGHIYPENFFVMRLISKSKTPYILFSNDMGPSSDLSVLKPSFFSRLRKMKLFSTFLNRVPLFFLSIRPADYVVYGGEKCLRPLRLVTEKTKSLWAHLSDYELYLDEIKNPEKTSDTAVFLDQNLGFHIGAKAPGFTQVVDPDYFYPRLRALFDRIESELGLRVIIAAHPRADYSQHPDLFGKREVQAGNTIKLLRASKLAICSYSTAAGMAVLFRKPLLIYTLRSISNLSHAHNPPEALARSLGTIAHDIANPSSVNLDNILKIDAPAYEKFVHSYIKSPRSSDKRLWELLIDVVLHCSGQKGELIN